MTTEVKEKRAINRLQSMYALRAVAAETYQKGQEASEAGRPVVWAMMESFASPIFNAIGLDSVYPENYGTLCAASGDAIPYLERAAAEGFPTHMCGYCLNAIGYAARMMDLGEIPPEAPRGGMPKPLFLLASGQICDARFKFFQAMGRYFGAPVYTLEGPHAMGRESLMEGVYEREVNFLVTEVREFAAFLERLLGKKVDWDRVGEQVDSKIEMDAVWYQVTDGLRVGARPCPMHGRDVFSAMTASFFRTTDPKRVKDLYQKMADEIKYRVDNKIAGINYEEKYRVALEGLPPWHSLGFFDSLAERGWNLVHEGYHPPDPIDLSWVSDPVEKLVRYRYQGLAQQIDFEFEPEEAAEVKEEIKRQGFSDKLAIKEIKDSQADGVFAHPLLTCHSSTSRLYLRQSQYLRAARVPCLVIPGDMVDIRVFDPVDAMRKAEAFEDTMDYYKRVRKEEGLEW